MRFFYTLVMASNVGLKRSKRTGYTFEADDRVISNRIRRHVRPVPIAQGLVYCGEFGHQK